MLVCVHVFYPLFMYCIVYTLKLLVYCTDHIHGCNFRPWAPCGLRGCKNWPTPFPGRMSCKATKPGLVFVLYLSMHYTVLLFIRAPFYVSLVFVAMCSVLVVLVKLSVLAKWLARKTSLKKPNCGKGIVSRKPRQKSAYDFLGLLYCFIVLLRISFLLPLHDIFSYCYGAI